MSYKECKRSSSIPKSYQHHQNQFNMSQTTALALNAAAQKFIKDLLSPWKQRIFLFGKLPSAWFMGVRVRNVDAEQSLVSLKYSWWSQNPFKSIYFAAQAAAAELSTGVLAMLHLQGKGKFSMLVKDMQGSFEKKATGLTYFRCLQGEEVAACIQKAIETKEPQTIALESIGTQKDENGEERIVSKFTFTWTFLAK
jgi:hypothetical protein